MSAFTRRYPEGVATNGQLRRARRRFYYGSEADHTYTIRPQDKDASFYCAPSHDEARRVAQRLLLSSTSPVVELDVRPARLHSPDYYLVKDVEGVVRELTAQESQWTVDGEAKWLVSLTGKPTESGYRGPVSAVAFALDRASGVALATKLLGERWDLSEARVSGPLAARNHLLLSFEDICGNASDEIARTSKGLKRTDLVYVGAQRGLEAAIRARDQHAQEAKAQRQRAAQTRSHDIAQVGAWTRHLKGLADAGGLI